MSDSLPITKASPNDILMFEEYIAGLGFRINQSYLQNINLNVRTVSNIPSMMNEATAMAYSPGSILNGKVSIFGVEILMTPGKGVFVMNKEVNLSSKKTMYSFEKGNILYVLMVSNEG